MKLRIIFVGKHEISYISVQIGGKTENNKLAFRIWYFAQKHATSPLKKINRFMLLWEITAVYCENHKKHPNRLRGQDAVFNVKAGGLRHYATCQKVTDSSPNEVISKFSIYLILPAAP
jgi:hypothetical protein